IGQDPACSGHFGRRNEFRRRLERASAMWPDHSRCWYRIALRAFPPSTLSTTPPANRSVTAWEPGPERARGRTEDSQTLVLGMVRYEIPWSPREGIAPRCGTTAG